MSFLPLTIIVFTYIIGGVAVALHLHDNRGMEDGHAILGGFIWPFVVYRAFRNGYFTDFIKKLDETTK